jgi:hypothetical protein
MPFEAEQFYAQEGMQQNNLTLDWWPVGSGPYYLSENAPNRRMVLTRNPYYDSEAYPSEGEPGDAQAGLLADAGKPLPLIDRIVFSLEKETIPYWNKFLQGYYDASGISSDSFDQAVQVGVSGEATVSEAMKVQGIGLSTSVRLHHVRGFNWLIGGGRNGRRLAASGDRDHDGFRRFIILPAGAASPPVAAPARHFRYREGEAASTALCMMGGRPQRSSIEPGGCSRSGLSQWRGRKNHAAVVIRIQPRRGANRTGLAAQTI